MTIRGSTEGRMKMVADQDQPKAKAGNDDGQVPNEESFDQSEDVQSPVSLSVTELTDDEVKILATLKKLDLEYTEHESDLIYFKRLRDWPGFRAEGAIHRDKIQDLSRQLDDELIDHSTNQGFVVPSRGYAEIVLRDQWPRPGVTAERILELNYDRLDCRHQESDAELPSLPFTSRSPGRVSKTSRIHLVSTNGGPCVELSNASPLAMLLYGRRYTVTSRNLMLTMKVDCGSPLEKELLIQKADELVRSLVYELDIRNGRILSHSTRPLPRDARTPPSPRARMDTIRYPQIWIQGEVADLFNFASDALNNPPLAFLSYYQTLEYFIPAAVRQNAFRRIRRELRDPTFDRNSDTCILRIMSTAERTSRLPESEQLRTLVREYVRRDRLEDFFTADWGNYFTKRGPIYGVELISPENRSKDLGDQVADRIYQIRNRIVHAKDDPRYEDARVLLPRSQEAESLHPDIELVRLLAMEAILASQGA